MVPPWSQWSRVTERRNRPSLGPLHRSLLRSFPFYVSSSLSDLVIYETEEPEGQEVEEDPGSGRLGHSGRVSSRLVK